MKFFVKILIFLILNTNFVFAQDILLEAPIELKTNTGCDLAEFCKNYIDDINIEKFIKSQIKGQYVPVSLDECLNIALLNNFDIKIQDHTFKSAEYNWEYTLTKFLPNFDFTSYIAHYAGQILVGEVLSDDFNETAISVNFQFRHDLTKGGQEIFEAKAAKYFQKSKKHNLNFTKTEVIYMTSRYYYEALLAKIQIEIYLRNLVERNAQLSLTKSQEKSGFGTHFDVIRSQNESLDAKNKVLNALNDFRIAQSKLANIMGIEVETLLLPYENEAAKLTLSYNKKPLEKLFDMAVEYREDLKNYKDLINYERQVKNIYLTEFIPKPYITFQQQFQGTIKTSVYPNYILSAYLTWQPGSYFGMGTYKKIKEQNEVIKTKKLDYENKLRNIKEALVEALSTSNFNEKQIDINKQRVEFSKESIKLAMMRFKYGKGIFLDVIQAQNEMTSARVQYVSAIISFNISQLELLYNSGVITKELVIENYKP